MTDEEEFSARSQLKWTREGDAWILLYRRRRIGRVVPDKNHPGMWALSQSGRHPGVAARSQAVSPMIHRGTHITAGRGLNLSVAAIIGGTWRWCGTFHCVCGPGSRMLRGLLAAEGFRRGQHVYLTFVLD